MLAIHLVTGTSDVSRCRCPVVQKSVVIVARKVVNMARGSSNPNSVHVDEDHIAIRQLGRPKVGSNTRDVFILYQYIM